MYPKPESNAVIAFFQKWDMFCYIVHPFILINRVLTKVVEDRTPKAIIVVVPPNLVPQTNTNAHKPLHLPKSTPDYLPHIRNMLTRLGNHVHDVILYS